MHEPVAKENMADTQPERIRPRLLLGRQRFDAFLLRLDHRDRPAVDVEQHIIDKPTRHVLEVRPEIEIGREDLFGNSLLADDVFPPPGRIRQKPPPRRLQQLVDSDPGLGFGRHVSWLVKEEGGRTYGRSLRQVGRGTV